MKTRKPHWTHWDKGGWKALLGGLAGDRKGWRNLVKGLVVASAAARNGRVGSENY